MKRTLITPNFDDYPAVYGELTVTGVFDTYEESGYTYLQLIDAVMSF